ncbi:DUF4163 domain-containing protein [Paraclostridium sordellii]|uniref:DUF4163 domain-containing protein n=1 Tax=Paraclostridium sordellii TaxID=1505 RepID=UPI0005E126AE|nr:DUF4163 domain-containing protein [Paeniclostridium sordellii]CEP81555.1 Protein of uncharacterised function (DUF3298) [[Clostridium] sordellii] [Paeniclostridium sordellii]
MIDIKTRYINIYNDKLNCTIEYPEICIVEKNIFIQKINRRIKEDINIFIDMGNENFQTDKDKSNIFIDYKLHFNKNNIVSLTIIFSEIYRYKNLIKYVKTYNFDLNKEQIINIKDLIKEKYRDNSIIGEILNEYIDDMQNFYIEENSINLIYSSYEIYNKSEIIEMEIKFKDIFNYLSEYTIQRIMGEEDEAIKRI